MLYNVGDAAMRTEKREIGLIDLLNTPLLGIDSIFSKADLLRLIT